MKSFTDHPYIAAADGTVVGSVLSSDDGAISSGIAIAPTEGVDGLIADGETINGTMQSATSDVESPIGLQRKGLRVSFPEFEVVSGYMDPPRPWNDGRCSFTVIIWIYFVSISVKLPTACNVMVISIWRLVVASRKYRDFL